MNLKNFLEITDEDTRVSICIDLGPIVNAKPAGEITFFSVIDVLDRPISRIYYDKDDNSITLEL